MGGAVSTGKDNDDLTDKLAEGNYIKTILVEKLFRAVDRSHYFLPNHKDQAYRDTAWRSGNIHMSAPCIYSEVLEALELKSGLSFLNLGSGTGYLSTMVGFALGPYAINHGIELYPDVVNYAQSRWNAFVQDAESWDEFDDLAVPVFVSGNCLLCSTSQSYDRIYCGAACPESQLTKLKALLRPGGVLVVPISDRLVQFRLSEDGLTWSQENRMPVSFAGLITPKLLVHNSMEDVDSDDSDASSTTFEPPQIGAGSISPEIRDRAPVLPSLYPPTLQQACRFIIRRHLRTLITAEHPELIKERRSFDREAHKRSQESRDDENDNSTEERRRPSRRRRTRFVPVGNNFGVVIISENDSSSGEESDGDEEGSETERPNEESGRSREPEATENAEGTGQQEPEQTERNEAAGEEQERGNRPLMRAHMPNLLRLLLETRRLRREQEHEDNDRDEDNDSAASSNSRRRRRVSSTSAGDESKKQKEASSSGESSGHSPSEEKPSIKPENTGRRLSRYLHERVHELQLPVSVEAFLLFYRPAPEERMVVDTVKTEEPNGTNENSLVLVDPDSHIGSP